MLKLARRSASLALPNPPTQGLVVSSDIMTLYGTCNASIASLRSWATQTPSCTFLSQLFLPAPAANARASRPPLLSDPDVEVACSSKCFADFVREANASVRVCSEAWKAYPSRATESVGSTLRAPALLDHRSVMARYRRSSLQTL